jgi:hypothetical protein
MLPSRKFLPFAAVFLFSFASPQAHADTIDDFVLVGNGETITLALPASPPGNMSTCPVGPISCLPGSETAFYLSAPVTINGVTSLTSLAFPTFRFGGGLSIGLDPGRLGGSQAFGPDASNPTFIFGTYTLDAFNPSFPPAEYTLTIAEEDPTPPAAQTPEPGSLALLATGVGLFALAGIRPRATSF